MSANLDAIDILDVIMLTILVGILVVILLPGYHGILGGYVLYTHEYWPSLSVQA